MYTFGLISTHVFVHPITIEYSTSIISKGNYDVKFPT